MLHKGKNSRQVVLIALALAGIALLSMAVGTMAWLKYQRGLVTMTQIQFATLKLTGETDASLPIELGEINIQEAGRKEMPFRITSKPGTQYILQLGHTTNLPLRYSIYPVDDWYGTKPVQPLDGGYINPSSSNSSLAAPTNTYDTGDTVQQNAEPLYWQSGARVCSDTGIDYYVLVVSWEENTSVYDKETEMIYLTAGLGGYSSNETSSSTN